ncbi:MAG: hypothetical protein Q9201_000314 [Fulgogasparrea decipioides]
MSHCHRSYYHYSHNRAGSSWFTKGTLTGASAWESDYERANIAFEIITVLCLLAICIWGITSPKQSPAARKLFVWFITSIVFAIMSVSLVAFACEATPDRVSLILTTGNYRFFLWSTINWILNVECARVQQLYFIFVAIFNSFEYLFNTFLLFAIFIHLIPLTPLAPKTPALRLHFLFCGLLFLLWLVALALSLAFDINGVIGTSDNEFEIDDAERKVILVYNLLYLLAALEVLGLGVMVFTSSRGSYMKRKLYQVFLCFVGIPLLIRQIWITAIDLNNNFNIYYKTRRRHLWFANNMFYYICTIAIYAALAFVIKHLVELEDDNDLTGDEHEVRSVVQSTIPRAAAGGLESGWKRDSMRDHAQDPIYNGPEVVREV